MLITNEFDDYEIISMSDGEKLERWGKFYLLRPDPEIIWKESLDKSIIHAYYHRSTTGGGYWDVLKKLPSSWCVNYKDLTFNVKLMGFKHTGIFPEQSVNWDFMREKIKEEKKKSNREIKVLNLFAYTGGATVAALSAGASVCHVDSSQGMVNWAKENVSSSGLRERPVRFLVDDVVKFVNREIRRNNKYDMIIMDPPSYGRGKNGEVWSIEKDINNLLCLCSKILSDNPISVIINTYTGGLSGTIIENVAKLAFSENNPKKIFHNEIGLRQKNSEFVLPCGITTICEF